MTRVLRAADCPRGPAEGPFGHLDSRWIVDAAAGATTVAFGQTTYPGDPAGDGATHELHYHPNAEEVVYVLAGSGRQRIGDVDLDLAPGDACFIPRSVPHRIQATSAEDLVILWVLGAASLDAAGYVSVDS